MQLKKTMEIIFEKIINALKEKTGVEDVNQLEYKDLPDDDELYNSKLCIGNINLISGRYKTKKEADKLVDEFLSITFP